MKKILPLVLFSAILLTIPACGKEKTSSNSGNAVNSQINEDSTSSENTENNKISENTEISATNENSSLIENTFSSEYEPPKDTSPIDDIVTEHTTNIYPNTSHFKSLAAEFDKKFATEILKTNAGKNISMSPYSNRMALSLLMNSVKNGDDKNNWFKNNFYKNCSIYDLNHYNYSNAQVLANNGGVVLNIANSIWIDNEVTNTSSVYISNLKKFYNSDVYVTDLPSSVKDINNWSSSKTNGKIPEILESLEDDAMAVLMNAVYLKADWAKEFDANLTYPATFKNADGSEVQTDFMHESFHNSYISENGVEGVRLAYTGDTTAMYVFTSDNIQTAIDYALNGNYAKPKNGTVELSIPKWKSELTIPLIEIYKNLGVPFTGYELLGEKNGYPPEIGDAVQKVYVAVDEKGTEAAAVTEITMVECSAVISEYQLDFSKPFAWVIRDEDTGETLFFGVQSKF